jgi:hypothetical protein
VTGVISGLGFAYCRGESGNGLVLVEFNVGKGLAVVGCIGMEGILSLVLIDGTVGIGRAEKLLRGETGFAFQLEVEFT